jgi:hypothetical protein
MVVLRGMHLLAEESVTVARPAAAVFAYVSDMERFGEWFPGVVAIASSDDLPPGAIGKTYRETVAIPLRGERRIELAVVESIEARRFATEARFPPLLPRMEIDLVESGPSACTLTWRMFSRNEGALARLWVPLARRVVRARAKAGLGRLVGRFS